MKGSLAAGVLLGVVAAGCSPGATLEPSEKQAAAASMTATPAPTLPSTTPSTTLAPTPGPQFDVAWERRVAVPGAAAGHTGVSVLAGGPGFVAYGATLAPGFEPTKGPVPPQSYAGIWTSTDGFAWTQIQDPGFMGAAATDAANLGGSRVAILGSANGGGLLWTSSDGVAWRASNLPHDVYPESIAYRNGRLVGVGHGIWVSDDEGRNWRSVTDAPRLEDSLTNVVATQFGFLATDRGGLHRTPALVVSTDGSTWSRAEADLSTLRSISAPVATPNGVLVVGTPDAPPGSDVVAKLPHAAFVLSSSDGIAWTRRPAGRTEPMPADVLLSAASTRDRVVVLGSVEERLALWTSRDGVAWIEGSLERGGEQVRSVAISGIDIVGVGWDAKGQVPQFWVGRLRDRAQRCGLPARRSAPGARRSAPALGAAG